MKKMTIIPVVLIGLLLTTGAALAKPGQHRQGNCNNFSKQHGPVISPEQHQKQMANRLKKMAVILDLTADQKQQIETLMDKKWEDRQALRKQLQTSRETLRTYKQGDRFDESEFRAIAQKHADLKTEMMVHQAKIQQQIFAVLTPEQQQKAKKLRGMQTEGGFGQQSGNCDGNGSGKHKGKGGMKR